MKQYVTRYETVNGKTRRVKDNIPPEKAGEKSGAPEAKSGAEPKKELGVPAK